MEFRGFDCKTFQTSVNESFKEPISALASSKETMFAGGNLAKIKSQLLKASVYLDELVKQVEPLTAEKIKNAEPSKLNDLLESLLKAADVNRNLFE